MYYRYPTPMDSGWHTKESKTKSIKLVKHKANRWSRLSSTKLIKQKKTDIPKYKNILIPGTKARFKDFPEP